MAKRKPDPAFAIPDEPESLGFNLIAIDPGDKYTGVAFFALRDDGWECVHAQEYSPREFEDDLAETLLMDPPGLPARLIVVYERWRLYADHAMEKVGNEFLACQHIGVLRYIVRVHNEHAERHQVARESGRMMTCELQGRACASGSGELPIIEISDQVADIKKPTKGILNKKKMKSVAGPIARELYGNRDHVKDAELHGWYHILRVLKEPARPSCSK